MTKKEFREGIILARAKYLEKQLADEVIKGIEEIESELKEVNKWW